MYKESMNCVKGEYELCKGRVWTVYKESMDCIGRLWTVYKESMDCI